MREVFINLLLFTILAFYRIPVNQQNPPTPTPAFSLSSPVPGQVLQGQTPIILSSPVDRVTALELSFSYINDSSDTWFLIYMSNQPTYTVQFYIWDTTSITDGNYNLRLIVDIEGGDRETFIIPDIRVRNYSPIETEALTSPTMKIIPSVNVQIMVTPTGIAELIIPTNTGLPSQPNPAILTYSDLNQGLLQGVLAAFVLFIFIGFYTILRSFFRRA